MSLICNDVSLDVEMLTLRFDDVCVSPKILLVFSSPIWEGGYINGAMKVMLLSLWSSFLKFLVFNKVFIAVLDQSLEVSEFP